MALSSGLDGGKSPGIEDGNGDGRGAIGVTAGPGAVIGRGADGGATARGGIFDFTGRRFADFALAFFALALRTDLRFTATFFLRAAPRVFARFAAFFFALRLFAMVASDR